ncbi:MAG TPA: glutamine synthetase [Proteobacteria bacterium]|nr:glutamine synthetase [Pseudomonadota bacterium]
MGPAKRPDYSREDVLRMVDEHGVRFIKLWFTDVLGFLKSFSITRDELERGLEEGMGFDGSSIMGFARIEESDMIAMPDPATFTVLPWEPVEGVKVGIMFCDIYRPTGEPFEGDPRWVLKRMLKKAASMGFTYYVGPELEYFYFKSSSKPEVLDHGGYFDLVPLDLAAPLRKETIIALEKMGVPVEYSHHEVAPSQHEIDLRYADALTMADFCMLYKFVVKEVAIRRGVYATFMPKPIFGVNGSGMHTHQSLFEGDKNAFFAPDNSYHLSDVARHFLGGLLEYAPEITIVLNQWVNSYKRLVPGYEAPAYICWGTKNRSALVRVPEYKPGKENATRLELRSPDPACNPYLAFAVMLGAGLRGIEEKLEPPEPVEVDVYRLSEEELRARNIGMLPANLYDAIKLAEQNDLLRETLGEHIYNTLLANKRMEWDEYRIRVTEYEVEKYLPIL